MEMRSDHVVQTHLYANDLSAKPPVSQREDLASVEPIYALLESVVGRPLANPILSPCRSPIMAVQGPAQSGALTAVNVWAATNSPRVNVITFKWTREEECGARFYSRLMEAASNVQPCILIIHRVTERAPPQGHGMIFNAIWQAYLRYLEVKVVTTPPFWLMFVDFHIPADVLSNWDVIKNVTCLAPFSKPERFMQSMIQQELRRLLATDDQVKTFGEFYAPLAQEIVQNNAAMFNHTRDVMDFVEHLFDAPIKRHSVQDMRAIGSCVSVGVVLPQPTDFDEALAQLQRTKEETQRQRSERQHRDEQREQEQQQKRRDALLAASRRTMK